MSAHSPISDIMRPFQLEKSQLRGRFVRLGDTIDQVLKAHDYPEAVSDLLGELLVLAGGLAGGLKFDGRFSLQVRGEGPIRLMVADVTNDGQMRGYASYDADAVEALETPDMGALVGKGLLALTCDQADSGGETYQGIVELDGRSLQDSMLAYFRRSEQVPTGIRSAIAWDDVSRAWRAGAIIVQAMPGQGPTAEHEREDDWRRAMLLLHTATDDELVDPHLPVDVVLVRLFHEDGVRVFRPLDLAFGCSCSEERVVALLKRFPREELEGMRLEDGRVEVTCQFCSRAYSFDEGALRRIFGDPTH